MFQMAVRPAFNQDIGDWAVQSDDMGSMFFTGASAFNQDLGWCLDEDDFLGVDTPCTGCSFARRRRAASAAGSTRTPAR